MAAKPQNKNIARRSARSTSGGWRSQVQLGNEELKTGRAKSAQRRRRRFVAALGCHPERGEGSLNISDRQKRRNGQRCFASLNMTLGGGAAERISAFQFFSVSAFVLVCF